VENFVEGGVLQEDESGCCETSIAEADNSFEIVQHETLHQYCIY
jgi:hypothetical protein